MEFLTEIDILERVDEYSLFCFYLEFDPIIGAAYSSPIRNIDNVPSFGLYERKKSLHLYSTEYMWKDAALSYPNFGDIFDLLIRLYPSVQTRTDAVLKIASDFGWHSNVSTEEKKNLIHKEPVFKEPSHIIVRKRKFYPRDLAYWSQYNVGLSVLEEYNAEAVEAYWLNVNSVPFFPSQCYAYNIKGKYQLYTPFAKKKRKFINNWGDFYIPGWFQLKKYDNLIITKAYKDVMCLASIQKELKADIISPKAENILLPSPFIEHIKKTYSNVIVLMDNDGKTSAEQYPFRNTIIPLSSGEKDPSDYMSTYGKTKTEYLIKTLLYEV